MKKKTMISIALIIAVSLLFSGVALARGKRSPEAVNAWKKLAKITNFNNIRVADEAAVSTGPGFVKRYILDLIPIRQALEEAGVGETVIITIGRGRKKVGTIGKFTPTLEEKDGKTVVSFASIPDEHKIRVANTSPIVPTNGSNKGFTIYSGGTGDPFGLSPNELASKGLADQENAFHLAKKDYIYFKNAKKKIKHRAILRYLYVSK